MFHSHRSIQLVMLGAVCLLGCSLTPTSNDELPANSSSLSADSAHGPGSIPTAKSSAPTGELLTAELSTIGWDQLSGSPVVLLRELETGQVLPIWIGMAEARAIGFELHGIEPPRPMTHDLTSHLITTLGGTLEEVVIHDLRDGTYYGLLKLSINDEGEPHWLDTRPSDGLALALRSDATIRIDKKLLDKLPDYQFMPPESPEQVVRAAGLTVVLTNSELREEFSLPDRPGLVVIATSGEAQRRGLRRGDLIVAIDDRAAREPLDLLEAIENNTRSSLSLTYWRDGVESTIELALDAPRRQRIKNVA